MTDFKNGQELLEVCKKKQCSISEVMKQREIEGTSSTKKEVEDKMRKALAIMKESVRKPLEDPKPSMSGLIGGEAKQITGYRESGKNVCGTFMNKLIAYSMAVLEVNASMGVIVRRRRQVLPVWFRACSWHCRRKKGLRMNRW